MKKKEKKQIQIQTVQNVGEKNVYSVHIKLSVAGRGDVTLFSANILQLTSIHIIKCRHVDYEMH